MCDMRLSISFCLLGSMSEHERVMQFRNQVEMLLNTYGTSERRFVFFFWFLNFTGLLGSLFNISVEKAVCTEELNYKGDKPAIAVT